MRILSEPAELERALQKLMRHLKKGAVRTTAQVRWRGRIQPAETYWRARDRYWFSPQSAGGRLWLRFGLCEPGGAEPLDTVCTLGFNMEGADRRSSGLFLRFGTDVLLAHGSRPGGADTSLAQFLGQHEYGVAAVDATLPDGGTREALVISSIGADTLSCNVARFVGACRDFREWDAQGLLPGAQTGIDSGAGPRSGVHGCEQPSPHLLGLAVGGLREQLDKFSEARKLGLRAGYTPQGELALAGPDGALLAVFAVLADLSPRNLQAAVGGLALSRRPPRAARFLVVPGSLGAFLSQALFRHAIHVVTYKLTQDMSVVLDVKAIFDIVRAVD